MKTFLNTLAITSALALITGAAYAANQSGEGAAKMQNSPSGSYSSDTSSGTAQGSTSANVSASQVKDAQEALKDKGYTVSIDGIVGSDTAKAIRKFQEDSNLAVTGTLTEETLKALNVASANPRGGASGY